MLFCYEAYDFKCTYAVVVVADVVVADLVVAVVVVVIRFLSLFP